MKFYVFDSIFDLNCPLQYTETGNWKPSLTHGCFTKMSVPNKKQWSFAMVHFLLLGTYVFIKRVWHRIFMVMSVPNTVAQTFLWRCLSRALWHRLCACWHIMSTVTKDRHFVVRSFGNLNPNESRLGRTVRIWIVHGGNTIIEANS